VNIGPSADNKSGGEKVKSMLNEEQKRAVEEFSTDLLVMAGAGTGKTRVLTHKYLHLLKAKIAQVPQIVAVTFTNKAADEMRSRIRQELETAYYNSDGPEGEYWLRQLELLEVSAKITTIHGLCFTLLKQHPVEAGIAPRLAILNEGEEYLFKAKAAKRSLSNLLAEDVTGANLSVVLALGTRFFLEQLPTLYTVLREAGAEIDRLDAATLSCGTPLEKIKTQLVEALNRLRQEAVNVKLTPRAQELLATLYRQWPDAQNELHKLEHLSEDALMMLGDLLSLLPKNLNKQLRPTIDEVHDWVEQLQTALVSREAERQKPILLAFLRHFDREYNRLKQLESKLDFTDQQYLVRKLLRDHPAIVAEYRRRFLYLMIDEFQDTNSLQWEIIQLLRGDQVEKGRLFLVGDLKQSIYRFRGAEVEIMTKLAASKLGERGQTLVLAKNYRTKPAVAEVINGFCQPIFATEAFPYQPLVPAEGGENEGELGVEILLVPEKEPEMLAARLHHLVETGEFPVGTGQTTRAVQYGDIAVLFRTKTHLKAFEDAFRTAGIPYQVTAGVGFYARQEIQDQLNFLRLVECPGDALALAGVLRSPFCQVSDHALFWLAHPHGLVHGFYNGKQSGYPSEISGPEKTRLTRLEQLLSTLSQNAHLLPIPALLRWAWTETGYLETITALPEGKRCLANLEKLILQAEEFAANGYSGVGDFVAFLRHLSALEIREGEASFPTHEGNFVQMMTIHAAKGLEFPVVVLPELDAEFKLTARSTVFYTQDWGIIHKIKGPDGRWLETEKTREYDKLEKRAEISELKRLFYVGMTRARDYLLFSGTDQEAKAATIDESRSWLDWLVLVAPEIKTGEEGQISVNGYPLKITRSVPTQKHRPVTEVQPVAEEIAASLEIPLPTGKITTRRLSLTPLLTFQECPRRFYWQHRLGADPAWVPAGQKSPAERITTNYSLLLGDVFHRLIAAPQLKGGESGPAFADWFQGLRTDEQQAATVQLNTMYQNYLASPFLAKNGVQVENELPFVLALNGVIIKGIIDRVLFYPDGRLVVVDFKTNRHLPPAGKIRNRYYFQVYLYALALREIYGRLPSEAWIYFVQPDIQLPCPLTEKNLGATEEEIIKTVEYITTHDRPEDYPPGANCEFCPFTLWCKETVSSSQ
jgi:ATP-dependent helicase/nuclease subunit A